ncbi:MAG: phosphoribosyl-ATP diphosphatase [Nocardioides sp.]
MRAAVDDGRRISAVKTFDQLWMELSAKTRQGDPESGTARRIADTGVHGAGKKVVEEAAEAWMAAEHESKERAAEEISQLLYQTQVLMLASGVDLADVYEHL